MNRNGVFGKGVVMRIDKDDWLLWYNLKDGGGPLIFTIIILAPIIIPCCVVYGIVKMCVNYYKQSDKKEEKQVLEEDA